MKSIKFFAVAILFSGVSVISSAQVTNNATTTADVTIIKPITIVSNQNLEFGTIAVNGAGTVEITAAGVVTPSTNISLLTTATSATRKAAKFTITGEPTYKYSIALADQDGTANVAKLTGAGEPMIVNLINGKAASANVLAAGNNELFIGGTLNVASGQLSGAYTGTFKVTVAYE